MTDPPRQSARAIEVAAGVALAIGLASWLTGGVTLGPWSLPVRAFWRPIAAALVLVAIRAGIGWRASPAMSLRDMAASVARSVTVTGFAAGIVTGILVWMRYQVRFCGGLDSYGYVSAAAALADATLVRPQPLAAILPFAHGIAASSPLGWVPAPDQAAIVPAYPLGFPLLMAAAVRVAGLGAAFYVPLLAGLGILLLTYRLTRECSDAATAAAATLVVAFNPVMMNMVVQPMSDVPAAFWYLLAMAGVLVSPARPALAGLAFGMAVWTRPLLVTTLPALVWAMPRTRRALYRLIAGGAVVAVPMALTHWHLYGHPLRTGYGRAAGLFTTAYVTRHLGAFTRWLVAAHSPLAVAALAVGLWRAPRRLAVAASAGLLLGLAPYLFHVQFFDDVDLIRYVLPELLPCLIVAALGVAALVRRIAPAPVAGVILLTLASAAAAGSYAFVSGTFTFHLQAQESRYAAVADWVAARTPANAVVMADLHSGTLRLYANRMTLRWVVIPPGRMAATIDALTRRGLACYAATDGEGETRGLSDRMAAEAPDVIIEPLVRIRTVTIFRLSPGRPAPAG